MIKAETIGTESSLFIYGAIGDPWDGITTKDVTAALKGLKGDTLNVHINSEGGIAFDGVAIMNVLQAADQKVLVTVDGIAASAASVVAMAGETITMASGSMMMIHNPWGVTIGDAGEMRKTADILDKIADNLATVYAARASRSAQEMRALMNAETWFTAEEAVSEGLADSVADEQRMVAAAWDLSHFCRPPESLQSIAASVRNQDNQTGQSRERRLTYRRNRAKVETRSVEDRG